MRTPKLPPVIERRPSATSAREVIHAAERGERLWIEGDEGIARPMSADGDAFARAFEREEDAMRESIQRSAEMNGQRVEFVGNTIVLVSGRRPRIRLGAEDGE